MLAYELAVRYYQASCYGDCWYLSHYGKSVNDSARVGEADFANKTFEKKGLIAKTNPKIGRKLNISYYLCRR